MFEKFFHYKEILGWISGFPVITEPPSAHCFELNYRLLKKSFLNSDFISGIFESYLYVGHCCFGQIPKIVEKSVVVCLGWASFSTIFRSDHDDVWLRQGAQCSLS